MNHAGRICTQIVRLALLAMLFTGPSTAIAQIDLFGNLASKLDSNYKHLTPPFDATRLYAPGWNVTPTPTFFEYPPIENLPVVPVPVPNTSQSFTNNTQSTATYPYAATCQHTVTHKWVITDGMTDNLHLTGEATFDSLPGIDAASPGTGSIHLTQGETVSKDVSYSQPVRARVSVPPNSTVTYQTYFDERPIDIPFEVDVKIGGSFEFQALRGDCGHDFPRTTGRCTTANFMGLLGTSYQQLPDPHIQVIDAQFVTVKLHGEYTGAVATITPGNFKCEVKAVQ
jgi:hypothetical protein